MDISQYIKKISKILNFITLITKKDIKLNCVDIKSDILNLTVDSPVMFSFGKITTDGINKHIRLPKLYTRNNNQYFAKKIVGSGAFGTIIKLDYKGESLVIKKLVQVAGTKDTEKNIVQELELKNMCSFIPIKYIGSETKNKNKLKPNRIDDLETQNKNIIGDFTVDYFVMKEANGSLYDLLSDKEYKNFNLSVRLNIILSILNSVKCLNDIDFLFTDIKLQNISYTCSNGNIEIFMIDAGGLYNEKIYNKAKIRPISSYWHSSNKTHTEYSIQLNTVMVIMIVIIQLLGGIEIDNKYQYQSEKFCEETILENTDQQKIKTTIFDIYNNNQFILYEYVNNIANLKTFFSLILNEFIKIITNNIKKEEINESIYKIKVFNYKNNNKKFCSDINSDIKKVSSNTSSLNKIFQMRDSNIIEINYPNIFDANDIDPTNPNLYGEPELIGYGANGDVIRLINHDKTNSILVKILSLDTKIKNHDFEKKMVEELNTQSKTCSTVQIKYIGNAEVNNIIKYFFIMQEANGSLNDLLKNEDIYHKFNLSTRLKIIISILNTLKCLNNMGFLYTDIKLANLAYICKNNNFNIIIIDIRGMHNKIVSDDVVTSLNHPSKKIPAKNLKVSKELNTVYGLMIVIIQLLSGHYYQGRGQINAMKYRDFFDKFKFNSSTKENTILEQIRKLYDDSEKELVKNALTPDSLKEDFNDFCVNLIKYFEENIDEKEVKTSEYKIIGFKDTIS